jgi:uncharacterized protein YaeQ
MALKSTVYKVKLDVVDIDRNYYQEHKLTLACHPSETEERLMIRVLAFALNAHERLEFGNGITDSEEGDLWLKDLTGNIDVWIDVGMPDEKALLKAIGKSKSVVVYSYSSRPLVWWDPIKERLSRETKLSVRAVAPESAKELSLLCKRDMDLQCTIQDGAVTIRSNDGDTVEVGLSDLSGQD